MRLTPYMVVNRLMGVISSREQLLEDILKHFLDLVPLSRKPAGQLSGGERQLLALAIGLSAVPQLLLLDEPLAGLDELHVRKVEAIIMDYRRSHSVAFLIVEHRFRKLAALADRCYGMRLGKTIVSLDSSRLRDPAALDGAMQKVFFE